MKDIIINSYCWSSIHEKPISLVNHIQSSDKEGKKKIIDADQLEGEKSLNLSWPYGVLRFMKIDTR